MSGHQCYHCKQWIEPGEAHDCWTTTEAVLTADLPDDLREAWERLRETAAAFGDQRIYASHHCIMFARKACYFFVRPKPRVLEILFFLGRRVRAPQIRRAVPASARKIAHVVHIKHRDEVEPPITDWLLEAYEMSDALSTKGTKRPAAKTGKAAAGKKSASRSARKRRLTSRSSAHRPRKGSRTRAG